MQNPRIRGIGLAILGPLLWGISGTTAQFLFTTEHISANWLVSVRMFVSGILLVLFGFATNATASIAVWRHWRDAIKLVFFSFVGMSASQYTYFKAIEYGNAATATIFQFLSPAVIIIYLMFRTRHLPRRVDVISLAMALTGTILLVTHGHLTTLAIPLRGLLWGLATAITASIYTLLPGKLLRRYGSIPVVGWSMLIGGASFSCFYQIWDHMPTFSWQTYGDVSFVVIFGTMFAYLFYLQSLSYIQPTTASVLGSFEPLSATILSIIFLGISFGLPETIGGILILGTVGIQSWAAMKNNMSIS
ncbi:DMT family transporter [Lentilactobacillus kisonensis]|uniref:DMT family transporter n=1 Tax=Lentilactobacillus kisonensis TaxID=481722 RepID=UPI0002D5B566|nr:DMT family transporter [Lentilactobacillus kisonensis]